MRVAATSQMAMNRVVHPLQRHIRDIKKRLILIGATIMVFFVVAFMYSGLLIDWFKRPFEDDLIFYAPTEALFASIKISFMAAVIASMPVILHQFWKFIEPALKPGEGRYIKSIGIYPAPSSRIRITNEKRLSRNYIRTLVGEFRDDVNRWA